MPPSAMMGLVATREHHFSARQLPAAGAEAGLELGDADLARADADLGGVGAPVLEVDHRLGRGHVAGDDEGLRQPGLDVLDGLPHAVGMAMRDVDGDVVGADAFGGQAVDDGEVCGLTPELIDTSSPCSRMRRAKATLSRSKRCMT
jgi:hypothetical protein